MRIDLSGRTVLVTGGGRGIGAAVSRRFAGAGARVLVHYGRDRDAAQAVAAEIGGGATVLAADLADPRAAAALWGRAQDAAREAGGEGVDVLVNNAGVAIGSPTEGDDAAWLADWERTMAVNSTAPALLCRAACASFAARHAARPDFAGRIVNLASRAAFRGDAPDYLAYAASKGALVALTRSLARGWGGRGVRAFVVAPGFTRTAMAQDFIDRYGEAYAASDIALPRLTEPDDVAPTVVFLASGLADHATGTSVDVNAGSYVR